VPLAAAAAAAADAEDDSEADERLVLAEDDCDELDIQPCTYTHTHIYMRSSISVNCKLILRMTDGCSSISSSTLMASFPGQPV